MSGKMDMEFVARECQVAVDQVSSVFALLDEGNTVPFISRYRKEKTGNLDEERVNRVFEAYLFLKELNDRKETILNSIASQEKLTDHLKKRIEACFQKPDLEDLYLPFKPKKRTKASIARDMGLAPLAELLLGEADMRSPEVLAESFLNPDKGVDSLSTAVSGASHILAERFSENAELRKSLRNEIYKQAILEVSVQKTFKDKRTKFEQYYDYREKLSSIPSHRLLAIWRGESEKILRKSIASDRKTIIQRNKHFLFHNRHVRNDFLETVFEDALGRLILPSIENEVMNEKKKQADEEAIAVFASNLEKLLLAPMAGNLKTLAIDPGFRTGCKVVALDGTGKLLDTVTIFPNKPQQKTDEAAKKIQQFIEKYKIEAIAIGNGTASRETLSFIKSTVDKALLVMVVSESGASVYSASATAREEFPDQDVTVRGAVSIGRRFQDPLSELVKIDPKSIGVGQYQHDVNQGLLARKLDHVVSSVVNRVGVEVNTASYHLLRYVSGIGDSVARNIAEYRNRHGAFGKRSDLLNVSKFGKKGFTQSAGFLRIRNGVNPLEVTGIHPESYGVVDAIMEATGLEMEQLLNNTSVLDRLNATSFQTEKFGLPTVKDIISELKKPGRDPRKDFEVFEFADGIESIDDLESEMVLKGVVTNVTHFGAFVDIGVHQDGLVHVSELSTQFVSNPETVVAVGDKVQVKVMQVDRELKRIQLSMKALMKRNVTHDKKPAKKHRKKQMTKANRESSPKKPVDPVKSLMEKWGK